MTISLAISIISLALCAAGFLYIRRYIQRKTAATELLADYRGEIYRLIAEIDAATDRDSLLVEERINTLRKLLEDTDRRISVYMRELQRSRNAEAMYASLGRGIRAALDSRPPQLELTPPPEVPPLPQKAPNMAVPNLVPHHEPEAAEAPAEGKRDLKKAKLKTQIAELSAEGLSPQEIASRLNLSLAEVDLALNLLYQPG